MMPSKEDKLLFYKLIEHIVETTDYDWIEAILFNCQTTGMEVETASQLINDKLKKKTEESAISRNLLKKTAKLPI